MGTREELAGMRTVPVVQIESRLNFVYQNGDKTQVFITTQNTWKTVLILNIIRFVATVREMTFPADDRQAERQLPRNRPLVQSTR